jgi:hypothetical protein
MVTAAVGKDGTITGKMQHLFGNYAALEKRTEVMDNKDQEEYIRSLENKNKGLTITHYDLVNLDSLKKSYIENLEVEIADASLVAGSIISFSPLLFDQWTVNPFKPEDRKFPVDFMYPHIYKNIIIYEIPEGYAIDEKPADLAIALPDGKTKFAYKMVLNGNRLQISSVLDIGKSMYIFEEYPDLKEFFNKMVSKQAEKVVLKKVI